MNGPHSLAYELELSPKPRHPQHRGDHSDVNRLYEGPTKHRCSPQSPDLLAKSSVVRRSSSSQLEHVKTLMAKHMKTMAMIEQERVKLEEEQMKEIKDRPEINKTSKTVAERALNRKLEEHAKAELNAFRNSATAAKAEARKGSRNTKGKELRFKTEMVSEAKPAAEQPEVVRAAIKLETVKDPRPVAPDQFKAARVNSQLVHAFTTRSAEMISTPTCTVNILTGEGSDIELPKTAAMQELYDKVADLRSTRQALARTLVVDQVETPDPLEMGFMERGEFWLSKKHQRLKEQTDAAKETELDECTFKPTISRLKSNSVATCFNSTSNCLTYAEIHSPQSFSRRSLRKDASTTKSEASLQKSSQSVCAEAVKEAEKPLYASLSPVVFKCSYQSGFNDPRVKKTSERPKRRVNLKLK